MKVCVVGSGGREHALAWACSRAGHEVVVTPGNPGIPWSTGAPAAEIDADLFVLGPDDAVCSGMGDRLRAQGKRVFGPGADGGRLEGSKAWMKELLVDAGVPTARYGSFTHEADAARFLRNLPGPYVVKTDYLALGKGVLVTGDLDEAIADARSKLQAGAVVIEEAMTGPELSLFAVCDGQRAAILPPCQDYKRVGDGDTGPNTGGMGAYSPVPMAPAEVVSRAVEECVLPTLHALRSRDIDYRGVLYAGLMLTPEGPKVVEFNVRFGDPECQVLMVLARSDVADVLAEAADGRLVTEPQFDRGAAVTVVCAAEGYPAAPRKGDPISGLPEAEAVEGVTVFRAGVGEGPVVAGGRVLSVTGVGSSLGEARRRAYQGVECVSWPGMHHRTDIASAALDLERAQ